MPGPPGGRGEAVGRRRRGEDGERAAAARLGSARPGGWPGSPCPPTREPRSRESAESWLGSGGGEGGWGADPGSQEEEEAAAAWGSGFWDEEGAGDPDSRILVGGGLGGLDSWGPEERAGNGPGFQRRRELGPG